MFFFTISFSNFSALDGLYAPSVLLFDLHFMNTVIETMNMRRSTIITLTTDIIITPYSSHMFVVVSVVVSVEVVVAIVVVLVTPFSVIVVRSVEVKDEFLVVIDGEIVEVDVVMSDIAACLVFEINYNYTRK